MVNQANAQFVWNKKANIKHRTMIGPKEQGGLDMPDFQIINEALKVVWLRRLSDNKKLFRAYNRAFTKNNAAGLERNRFYFCRYVAAINEK